MKLWIVVLAICLVIVLFFKRKKGCVFDCNTSITKKKPLKIFPENSDVQETPVPGEGGDGVNVVTNTQSSSREIEYYIKYSCSTKGHKNNCVVTRWILPGEEVTICGVRISNGSIYVRQRLNVLGEGHFDYSRENNEASLIDDMLDVRLSSYRFEDSSLGYLPSYSTLSADARGAYINWLASDRDDPLCPIGYVFIYFYGIERRVLVDSQYESISESELFTLFLEVYRLRSVFIENQSFFHYSSRLLDAITFLSPGINYLVEKAAEIDFSSSMQFKFKLGTTVHAGEPVTAELALVWVTQYAGYVLKTPARRCEAEFSALFKHLYTLKFGEGVVVKPNKLRLRINYSPVSPSLQGMKLIVKNLPDPSGLKDPINKIVAIADECTEKLDAFSRYLSRKGTSRNDTVAILLLPVEIVNLSAGEVLIHFQTWADGVIVNNHGLTSVAEYWMHMGSSCPRKINKKDSDLMLGFAAKMGYALAPDPLYHNVKMEAGGFLVLRPTKKVTHIIHTSAFDSVVMMIRLGIMVAWKNNAIGKPVRSMLENAVDHNSDFTDNEKQSLHAFLTWQCHTPANMTGMKSKIARLSELEKNMVSEFIVKIACSDGRVEPSGLKRLGKIYVKLGLEPASLAKTIHLSLTTETSQQSYGESKIRHTTKFMLDADVLAHHESATDDVHRLLSQIFTQNETEKNETNLLPDNTWGGLDNAHKQFYNSLRDKEQCSLAEATELCKRFNLMLRGAIEVINDWSYAVVDAAVLDEDSNGIWVDPDVAEELEGV